MASRTNPAIAKAGNGIGPRTRIINLAKTNMTQAELDAAIFSIYQQVTWQELTMHTQWQVFSVL
jgi:hypothetical protein